MNSYRKWLAIGSGAGIEIGERDLDVTLVRVRPTGAETLAALRIERFAERPAAEWGSEYSRVMKRNGGSRLAATVLLPRRDVIVRQVSMPGVSDRDLPSAIAFQLDGLHPFSEDEAVHAWARMDDGINVLVGVTRREVIDRYSGLFAEAGIKVAAFTFSAAVIYGSLRLFTEPPADGFLAFSEGVPGEVEAYGESVARPLFSATFEAPSERFAQRAHSMALAELRLPADTPARALSEILPAPKRSPQGFELDEWALPYATAVVSACPRLGLQVNLLPPELRVTSSRMVFVPTIILGLALLAGAGSLAAYSTYEDRVYLEKLQAEVSRLGPEARKPMVADKAIEAARSRTILLDQFRKRTRDDLDALAELTKILEPPAFLMSAEISRDSIRISGEAPQASGLLRAVDKSPLFEGSEHAAPMTRSQSGEVFAIRARREGPAR